MKTDIIRRNFVFRRAADLASSGRFLSVQDVMVELRKEGIESGRYFSASAAEWLDELCERAREPKDAPEKRTRPAKSKAKRKLKP